MKPPHQWSARIGALLLPALLVLGLGLRSFHYLRDRAVWQDEAGLLLTVRARGFADLFLGRLDYHQAAPPLYLVVLKTVSLVLGDGSHALRLPSFLASCAALLLFVPVARRLLPSSAAPWAALLFAVSEQLLWHGSEAKAYSVDVLAAVVVLAVPCLLGSWIVNRGSWIEKSQSTIHDSRSTIHDLQRQLAAYTLLAPLLLLSSYPACFVCAGVLLAYLPVVSRAKQLRTWLAWTALALTIGATLFWLLIGPVRCQHDAEIHSCWVAFMPDWDRPWTVPRWLLVSPFEVCRYCCKPLGQFLVVLLVPGALMLWRRGERTMVRMMLAPIVLALLAACVHRYPFGGARVMAYAMPAILLLAAAGVPPVWTWLKARNRFAVAGLIFLLVLPAASSLEQVVHTWREADLAAVAVLVGNRRRGDDLIVGNDVAQQYYFRRLGPAFHLLDNSPLPAPPGERIWVVMTAALPREERVRMASQLAPTGWHTRQQHEFPYTTVLLFCR